MDQVMGKPVMRDVLLQQIETLVRGSARQLQRARAAKNADFSSLKIREAIATGHKLTRSSSPKVQAAEGEMSPFSQLRSTLEKETEAQRLKRKQNALVDAGKQEDLIIANIVSASSSCRFSSRE